MTWRTAQKISGVLTPPEKMTGPTADLVGWLESQPAVGQNNWLLAYAEDGVIWGKMVNGKLTLAHQVRSDLCRPLRRETLLEARLFGEQAEVHLWRSGQEWRACRVTDQPGAGDAFDEVHRLWGNSVDGCQDDFSVVSEPGLISSYVMPLAITPSDFAAMDKGFDTYRPFLLTCRHYFAYDEDTGEAYIALSRLVNLHFESFSAFDKRRKAA
jgi:CRISPR-associated protein (TIGR03984 family)